MQKLLQNKLWLFIEMREEKKVPEGINFTQYAISNIGSGVYEWRLRDNERVIKVGKIVILK